MPYFPRRLWRAASTASVSDERQNIRRSRWVVYWWSSREAGHVKASETVSRHNCEFITRMWAAEYELGSMQFDAGSIERLCDSHMSLKLATDEFLGSKSPFMGLAFIFSKVDATRSRSWPCYYLVFTLLRSCTLMGYKPCTLQRVRKLSREFPSRRNFTDNPNARFESSNDCQSSWNQSAIKVSSARHRRENSTNLY